MDALTCMRAHTAGAFSSILILRHAVVDGGFDPHVLRKRIESEIVNNARLDDEARELGFSAKHFELVRLALIGLADEVTQASDSRCDYSSPPPPNERSLLQQRHFRWDLGHRFFEELDVLLKPTSLGEVDHAVLEVFALCLSFGFRGKYEAFDIAGYEAMHRRVADKLRHPPLAGPPRIVGVPWPRPRPLGPWGLWVGGAMLLFCVAMLATYRGHVAAEAGKVRDVLHNLEVPALPTKVDS